MDQLRFVGDVAVSDMLPLAGTMYAGLVPVQHREAPRLWLRVYQVTADVVPLTSNQPEVVATWAATRHRPLPADSIRAVLRAAGQVPPDSGAAAIDAVARSGMAAQSEARRLLTQDPDPAVRTAAARVLTRDLRVVPVDGN
jgi:hypothetical protein